MHRADDEVSEGKQQVCADEDCVGAEHPVSYADPVRKAVDHHAKCQPGEAAKQKLSARLLRTEVVGGAQPDRQSHCTGRDDAQKHLRDTGLEAHSDSMSARVKRPVDEALFVAKLVVLQQSIGTYQIDVDPIQRRVVDLQHTLYHVGTGYEHGKAQSHRPSDSAQIASRPFGPRKLLRLVQYLGERKSSGGIGTNGDAGPHRLR